VPEGASFEPGVGRFTVRGHCVLRPAQTRSQNTSKCRCCELLLAGLLLEDIAYSELHEQGHRIQVSARGCKVNLGLKHIDTTDCFMQNA